MTTNVTAPVPADLFTLQLGNQTAASFQKLASLRGIGSSIVFKLGRYFAARVDVIDGEIRQSDAQDCGPSVHDLYDWLNKQPGVKP